VSVFLVLTEKTSNYRIGSNDVFLPNSKVVLLRGFHIRVPGKFLNHLDLQPLSPVGNCRTTKVIKSESGQTGKAADALKVFSHIVDNLRPGIPLSDFLTLHYSAKALRRNKDIGTLLGGLQLHLCEQLNCFIGHRNDTDFMVFGFPFNCFSSVFFRVNMYQLLFEINISLCEIKNLVASQAATICHRD